MEKKLLALLFLLILIPAIYAITIKDTVEPKESVVIRDKNITLISTTDESIKVCINGKLAIVSKSSRTVNGVVINIISSSKKEARLELSYSCPNCVCDESCDNTICLNECETDLDCVDGNRFTIDKCVDTPKTCVHEPIISKSQIKECEINLDCTDDDECTIDSCINDKCIYQDICPEQIIIQQIQQESSEEITQSISTQNRLIVTTLIITIVIVILTLIVLIKKR